MTRRKKWCVFVFPIRLLADCTHENNLLKALGTLWQNTQCCIFLLECQCGYSQDTSTVAGKIIVQKNIPVHLEISKSPGSGTGHLAC